MRSPSRALPADKRELLEAFDPLAGLRNGLRRLGEERDEWAGIPMPLQGLPLIIEPRYPNADRLMAIGLAEAEGKPDPDGAGCTVRNTFYSWRERADIMVWNEADGRIAWGPLRQPAPAATMLLETLMASDAWGIEQEGAAVQTLAGLLSHRAFKAYMMTGTFLEISKRSGVAYMFRRLRPTLALSMREGSIRHGSRGVGGTRILAALCLHPIGYYRGSWAGAMTPTDDVIAHLMLMRGDEAMFWRRANQHAPWRPEAGL